MRYHVIAFLASALFSVAASGQTPSPSPAPDPAVIALVKENNAQAIKANTLITEFSTAMSAKNWAGAEAAALKLVEFEPRSEYYGGLAAAQFNGGKYEAAAASFETSVTKAGSPSDIKAADAATRRRLSWALADEGNAYLKLKRIDDSVKAFTRAAEIAPEPGLAYFNLCATEYNVGNMDAAVVSCSKAIAADPTTADAYFIKGSALYSNGKLDADNKYVLPPGTVEALKKYLELAPNGAHVEDVKAMLDAVK